MIHVYNTVTLLMQELEEKGFKGVKFCSFEDETGEREDDEQTEDEWLTWLFNYAIFIAEPELPYDFDEPENEFVTPKSFDKGRFEDELKAWLQEKVGADVKITHYPYTNEWEFYRETED